MVKADNIGSNGFKLFTHMIEDRTNLTYSCCLWFAFLMSGWIYRQLGPALLDIQQITGVSFTIASTYIIAFLVGFIIGCGVSGYLQGRAQSLMLLCISCVGSAVFMTSLPWSTNAIDTYVINFFIGVCLGHNDSIVIAELSAVWGSRVSVPMQIAFFCYSVGGSFAEFAAATFLSKTIENNWPNNTDFRASTISSIAIDTEHFHNRLYIPFSFTATLTIVFAAILVLLVFLRKSKAGYAIEYVDIKTRCSDKHINATQKTIAVTIFGTLILLCSCINFNLFYLTTPFLVKLSVSTRSDYTFVTPLLMASQAVGRITGIATVQYLDHFSLLTGHLVICIMGIIGLWNSVIYETSMTLCFSVVTIGLGFSIIDASLKAWAEESFFPITGVISSFFFSVKPIGVSVSAFGTGYLMSNFSPFLFLYVTVGELLLFFVFVLTANCFRINKCVCIVRRQ